MDDPQAVILAWDEAWLWSQETCDLAWSLIGQPPLMKIDPQRYSLAFYGALNLCSGEEHAIMTDKLNQRTSASFLQYLLDLYPDRRLLLIGDRASWHRGLPIETLLSQHPRLELYPLPVACPELNPQEHIWASVRRALAQFHFMAFADRAIAFLQTLRATCFRPNLIDHYVPPIVSALHD
jgi:transposase